MIENVERILALGESRQRNFSEQEDIGLILLGEYLITRLSDEQISKSGKGIAELIVVDYLANKDTDTSQSMEKIAQSAQLTKIDKECNMPRPVNSQASIAAIRYLALTKQHHNLVQCAKDDNDLKAILFLEKFYSGRIPEVSPHEFSLQYLENNKREHARTLLDKYPKQILQLMQTRYLRASEVAEIKRTIIQLNKRGKDKDILVLEEARKRIEETLTDRCTYISQRIRAADQLYSMGKIEDARKMKIELSGYITELELYKTEGIANELRRAV